MDITLDPYYELPGTIRASTVADTLYWLKSLFPQLGITRVSCITHLDNIGLPVSVCTRPNAKFLSVSQGKGYSQELADISAIMEAVECFHGENAPPASFFISYDVAQQNYPNIINPELFLKGDFKKQAIKTIAQAWIKVKELMSNRECYIPHALTVLDTTCANEASAYYNISTNGLAAGNSFTEALCHSLYEVIERDSLSSWQQLRDQDKQQQELNVHTIHNAEIYTLIAKIKNLGYSLKIWHITNTNQIPSFHCALYDVHFLKTGKVFTGTGTHLNKEIALSRALTEAAQARLTYITGSRDDIFADYYFLKQTDHYQNRISNEPALDYNHCYKVDYEKSFNENVKQILQALKNRGISQVFLLDRTKADLNIPVTQVFVPELHFNKARM